MASKFLAMGLIVLAVGIILLYTDVGTTMLSTTSIGKEPIFEDVLMPIQEGNYSFIQLYLSSTDLLDGGFNVMGREYVGFYIMDQRNFDLWRRDQVARMSKWSPPTQNFTFSFKPNSTGNYYFVFDNTDSSRRTNLIFNLSREVKVYTPNENVRVMNYLLVIAGAALAYFGVSRTLKSRGEYKGKDAIKCKFCGAKMRPKDIFCPKCKKSQF